MRVVLVPPTEIAERVRGVLEHWSAVGLVRPFCWVALNEANVLDRRLPVQVVRDGESATYALGEALQGHGQPRLLAVYPFQRDEKFVEGFPGLVRGFADAARVVAAYDADFRDDTAIVVIGEGFDQDLAYEVFEPGLTPRVVVSSEDRADPTDASVLGAEAHRLIPHAAHAIASVADLWQESPTTGGFLEEIGSDQNPLHVRIARSFTRGIDLGAVVDDIAEDVLTLGDRWPNPDRTLLETISEPAELEEVLGHWEAAYWEAHRMALGCAEWPGTELSPQPDWKLLAAFRELWRRFKEGLRMLWPRTKEAIRRGAHDLGRMLFYRLAPDSGIRIAPYSGSALLYDERFLDAQLGKDFEEVLIEVTSHGYPSQPEARQAPALGVSQAWQDLVFGSLALMDGADPPTCLRDATKWAQDPTRRILLQHPAALVPRPLPSTLSGEVRSCDPRERDPDFNASVQGDGNTDSVVAEPQPEGGLAGPTDAARHVPDVALGSAGSGFDPTLETDRRTLLWKIGLRIAREERLAVQSERDLAAEVAEDERRAAEEAESDAAEQAGRDQQELAGEARRDRRRGRLVSVLSVLVAIVAGYLAWTQLTAPWRYVAVGAIVLLFCWFQVRRARRAALTTLERESPWARERLALAKGFRQYIRRSALGAFALLAGASLLGPVGVLGGILLSPLVFAGWLLGLALRLINYLTRRDTLDRQEAQRILDIYDRRKELALQAGSRGRLTQRYREYLDFAEIVGWFTYEPITGTLVQAPVSPPGLDGRRSPAAMVVRGARTTAQRRRLRDGFRRDVFTRGWLTDVERHVQARAEELAAAGQPDYAFDPFGDPGNDADGPRPLLLEAARTGEARTLADVPVATTLLTLLAKKPVDELVSSCPPIPPPLDAQLVPGVAETVALSVVWLAIENADGRRRAAAGVKVSDELVLTCRHTLGKHDQIWVEAVDGTRSGGEIFALAEGADLALIRVIGIAHLPSAKFASAPDVDGPVFAHVRQRGRDAIAGAAAGEVLRSDRCLVVPDEAARGRRRTPVLEIRYEDRCGYQGTPVFTASGDLIGLHSDAEHAAVDDSVRSVVRFAVPASEAAAFVADPARPLNDGLPPRGDDVALPSPPDVSPQEVLGVIIDVPANLQYLRPENWVDDREELARVADVWPRSHAWPVTLGETSDGGLRYGQQLRVTLHRLEFTKPHDATELKVTRASRDALGERLEEEERQAALSDAEGQDLESGSDLGPSW